MRKKVIKSIRLILAILVITSNVYGQKLQMALFNNVNKTMFTAKEQQADVLSPKAFEEAMEAYNNAAEEYRNNGELSEIKKNINKALNKFNEAIDNTKIRAVMFTNVLSARKDAINAEAIQFSKNIWFEAEEGMKNATKELEKGDANDAKEKGNKAMELYRKAELESIKANYLTSAKKLIEQADYNKVNKVAPKTYNAAKLFITKAEKELAENRYDTDEARHLAKEAEYHALLAMQIAVQDKMLSEKNFNTEDYLLMMYKPITRIGENMDIYLKFDQGIEPPVAQILTRLNDDRVQILNLETALYVKKQENENLKEILTEQRKIQESLKGQQSKEALQALERQQMLQKRIDQTAVINNKFDEIQIIFGAEEADVFRQKNDIIIRMIGVNFDAGKSQINQKSYALLSKVEQAANLFENSSIIVEGHTDSRGSDESNLVLSQERANAVLSYLIANGKIDESRFSTIGFGESKPVANNETMLGRKQNRRIDIIIQPISEDVIKVGIK
ncbi:OmpA family protein [Chondrinema litorale]|uniref:OmpA family protein n=1 Tax=Chondrinema litorale TaxID=2994555 RepID=UPI0025438E75|nr:OmpA family protein [Chondrinema litorale]UZR99948.1 OmpA family protein [Chondrinema litorale]